jgi:hypothetical protein
LTDPFVAFPEYTLGLKEKVRKQKMDDYMFEGLREEMRAEEEPEESDEDY